VIKPDVLITYYNNHVFERMTSCVTSVISY